MENHWNDTAADAFARQYSDASRDVALCAHASQLLGRERTLVLHGGGNSSVKTAMADLDGTDVEVLCVKGSGRDMDRLAPGDLTAVRLAPLRAVQGLDGLDDGAMENLRRAHMLDASQPLPSVEFLLHAFLPAKVLLHTHSDAVLALTNQDDPGPLLKEAFGDRIGVVPYVRSGFGLAKAAAETFAANPGVEGLVLLKHGIFTMGETAEQAYARMIELVSLAEGRIGPPKALPQSPAAAPAPDVAPILRGLTALPIDVADKHYKPFILDFRSSPEIRAFVDGPDCAELARRGTATPDYVIRTKPCPVVVPAPKSDALDAFKDEARAAIEAFQAEYKAYFERHNARHGGSKTATDSMPRIILVPGVGLFGLGATAKDAATAADLAMTNIAVTQAAESVGSFASIPEDDVFDIEYWAPEQAKLPQTGTKPLEGHVCMVTGGASGIGLACAQAFRDAGCEVAVLDLDAGAAAMAAFPLDGIGIGCDVTNPDQIREAYDLVCRTWGGVDFVVSNAGAAWQGRIGDVDDETLRKSFELNFWSHQCVSQNAVRIMRAQGTGGCLLYNTSKQAVNPGPDFGPYGLPKAATLFLVRQYAIDHGRDGVRANAVNADRIRSGLLTDDMVKSRSKARGLSEKDYMSGNLLGLEVTAEDVAQSFLHLALERKTTACVVTVDGGNIAAALR